MKIIKKTTADKLALESLFKPINGRSLKVERFDSGKYATPASAFVGKEVVELEGVHAVYPVRKQDKNGAYVALYCLTV